MAPKSRRTEVKTLQADRASFQKRPLPDSNRGWRICNPLVVSASPKSIPSCDDTASYYSTRRSAGNELDSGLQPILDAWPKLPEALKAGILAMIVAARKDE